MADAVHVVLALANLMEADGTLNAETAARVDLAVEMFERQSADRLMVIGWAYRPDSEIAIGDAMATYARARHGVDDAALLVNRYARDTSGDAILSRIQLGALFPKVRLTVATTDYHVPRVKT
ncbi:MAG: ElyC/SanA/YdcF family protein, partial [Pseudomonadota bacterium]